jgi:hypothetical protein
LYAKVFFFIENSTVYGIVYVMSVGGLNLEPLFHFPSGTVIDAIPPAERHKYYLRGASVGALALNVVYGINRVNPRDDLFMHVTTEPTDASHGYAQDHAHSLSRGGASRGHFSIEEGLELAELTGRSGIQPTPGIIIGFPRATTELVTHPESFQPVVGHEVPFSGIDPQSQTMLSVLTGVDVAKLPLTPGMSRPVIEQITIV